MSHCGMGHKNVTFPAGSIFPGRGAAHLLTSDKTFKTHLSISQPSIHLKYQFPVNNKITLSTAIGLNFTKLNAGLEQTAGTGNIHYSFSERKVIPSLRASLYYNITNSISTRVSISCSKNSNMRYQIPAVATGCAPAMVIEKNSLKTSLAIVYKL